MATTAEVLADALKEAGTPFIVGHPGGESVELMKAARLRDIDSYPDWFPDTVEARSVGRENGAWANYVRTSAPWPVKDRDAIYVSQLQRLPDRLSISVEADPDLLPETSDAVRIEKASGRWELEAVAEGTRITWQFHVDPGGNVPSGLANARVLSTPREALLALRAHFRQREELSAGR